MTLERLWAFIQLTRPMFLVGGALMYGLGAAIAHSANAPIDWGRYALGQLIVTSIQAMTQYANEYYDLEVDRAAGPNRTWFSGGSGVLPAGRLPPQVALNAARGAALVAAAGIGLALPIEPAASLIGVLAWLGGWFYSAPPIRLAARGLGEPATALILSLLAPLCGIVMQRGPVDARLAAVAAPLAFLNMAMLIVFELSDFDSDRRAGKRNLVVRLGRRRAGDLHSSLLVAALAAVWLAVRAGWIEPRTVTWTLVAVPLAVWQLSRVAWRARRGGNGDWLLHVGGLGLFTLTALSFLAGFLMG